jgi:hypothetical protein
VITKTFLCSEILYKTGCDDQMSVDIAIHVYENGLTEEDLDAFFSNCLGSKYFDISKNNYKAFENVYDKIADTDNFVLGEVSWDIPHWMQSILGCIGEDLPIIDADLIGKIEPHARPDLIQWLEEREGKQIFVVFW